jgi:hypothetical protein
MEIGYFNEAAHILTELLVNIFSEAEKQLQFTQWQFAQSVYEYFLQLLHLHEQGKWTCSEKSSCGVCYLP